MRTSVIVRGGMNLFVLVEEISSRDAIRLKSSCHGADAEGLVEDAAALGSAGYAEVPVNAGRWRGGATAQTQYATNPEQPIASGLAGSP